MIVKLDIDSRRVLNDIDRIEKDVKRNLRHGLYFIGKHLKKTASKNILKKGRKGRKYRIKGRKRLHTASVPGEAWANLTGKARKGIDFLVKGSSEFHFINDVKYAGYLEFGTSKMEPRPAHLIAIEENNRNIVNTLEDALDNAYNGVIK